MILKRNYRNTQLTDNLDKQTEEIAKFLMASAKQFRLPLHGSLAVCGSKTSPFPFLDSLLSNHRTKQIF